MREYIIAPVVIAILLGMAADLEDLALSTQERTTKFTGDAVNALDCAYTAQPLTDCSPDLFGHDFSEEIERTNEILEQAQDISGAHLATKKQQHRN